MMSAIATAAATTTATLSVARPRGRLARRRRPDPRLSSDRSVSVSSVVALGVASCRLPNRAHCRRHGLGERFEQVFEEIHRPNDCRNSAASVSRSGLTRSRTLSSRSASAARSGPHSSTSPAIASRLTRRSWPCSTSYGPASGLEEYPRGVRYSPQGSLRKGRKHLGADDRSLAALSARLVFFSSSGGGLGIHQPGSMTRGTRAKVKTPSGRARDRAKCPAVARSSSAPGAA